MGYQSHFPFHFFFQIPLRNLRNSQIPFPFSIFNIFFPFPVTKSQSLCGLKPIFPGQNLPIPTPILPLQDPHRSYQGMVLPAHLVRPSKDKVYSLIPNPAEIYVTFFTKVAFLPYWVGE